MRGEIDPGFELSLSISLSQLAPHLFKTMAVAKLPHERDAARAALAAAIVARMQASGWNVVAPPPPPIDYGR